MYKLLVPRFLFLLTIRIYGFLDQILLAEKTCAGRLSLHV